MQADYYEHRTPRDIILKPRQLGFTTLISGLFFADCLNTPNTTSVLMAHDLQSTEQIFQIAKLFWLRLPDQERHRVGAPKYDNRREFYWERIGSRFLVGTAGSTKFGRGQTINNLHCSEFAFWPRPEEALAALTEAVPSDGRIVVESTANGVGNYFHDLWVEAKGGGNAFTPQFYVWWEDASYRMPGPALDDLTPEEQKLKAAWGLHDDQIRWRRGKRRELRDRFPQEYPESDVTCFLASTRAVFDLDVLRRTAARIAGEPAPEVVTTLTTEEDRSLTVAPARLLVWKRPAAEIDYVIGADVGEGLADGDASCAVVLEVESGEQVAELHGRVPPERFAQLLAALGRWYNQATLAVERNNHGHSTLNTLRNVSRYRRLYYHVRYDHRHGQQPTLGWPTDQATKPILVDDLAAAVSGEHIGIRSAELVDECMTFVTTDSGAQQAQQGKHDDRVMATGIAWQARKRGRRRRMVGRPEGW